MRDSVRLAMAWAIRCFGHEHVYDQGVRSLRLTEEAIELAQACQVPKQKMLDLVEIVYSRPVGKVFQEAGGVLLTASIFCASIHQDPDEVLLYELQRVLAKPKEHFVERNQDKIKLGLD